jgi:cellobiose-specific phosphotransferase system component IIA
MTNRDTHECFMRQARAKLAEAFRLHQYGRTEAADAKVAEAANSIASALGVAERRPSLKVAA